MGGKRSGEGGQSLVAALNRIEAALEAHCWQQPEGCAVASGVEDVRGHLGHLPDSIRREAAERSLGGEEEAHTDLLDGQISNCLEATHNGADGEVDACSGEHQAADSQALTAHDLRLRETRNVQTLQNACQ